VSYAIIKLFKLCKRLVLAHKFCWPCRRPIKIHTAEPLVLKPSAFEVEMAIQKLKRY